MALRKKMNNSYFRCFKQNAFKIVFKESSSLLQPVSNDIQLYYLSMI